MSDVAEANEDTLNHESTCPICLAPWRSTPIILMDTCQHGFHVSCIKSWILGPNQNAKTCPLCRAPTSDALQSQVMNEALAQNVAIEDIAEQQAQAVKIRFSRNYFVPRSPIVRDVELSFTHYGTPCYNDVVQEIREYLKSFTPQQARLCSHHICINMESKSNLITLSPNAFETRLKKPSFLARNVLTVTLLDEKGESCPSSQCGIDFWANVGAIEKTLEESKSTKEQDFSIAKQIQKAIEKSSGSRSKKKNLNRGKKKKRGRYNLRGKMKKKKGQSKVRGKKSKKGGDSGGGGRNPILFDGRKGSSMVKTLTSLHDVDNMLLQKARKKKKRRKYRNHNRPPSSSSGEDESWCDIDDYSSSSEEEISFSEEESD